MENTIYRRFCGVGVSRFVRICKQLVCLPSTAGERMRILARGKIERLSNREWHPGTFPIAMTIGMGLLWAHLNGYLRMPITVCDWGRFLGW